MLADLFLHGFRKIPFTCSYLPGKSQVHMKVVAAVVVMSLAAQSVLLEQHALQSSRAMLLMLSLLGVMAAVVRWRAARAVVSDAEGLHFEEEGPTLLDLGLYKDGGVIGGGPRDSSPINAGENR